MSTKWQVIERGSNRIMGIYSTAKRARNKRDKLDLEYGAVKYYVIEIETN